MQVLDSTGHFRAPDGAILKRGPGEPFFYCEREFAVDVPRGQVDVVVERGTEYRPLRLSVDAPAEASTLSRSGRYSVPRSTTTATWPRGTSTSKAPSQ